MAARSGIRYGLNTGHPTTPRETRPRISRTKGKTSKRTTFVRSIVREVSGFAPYERRCMELIRNGADKKARKLAKKRLGTLRRAKRKTEDLTNIIAEMRRQGH